MDEYQEMGERMKARFSSIENGETADPSAPPTEMDEDVPTAPTLPSSDEGAQPSAPPIETFQSAECVVCMERKVKSLENSSVLYFIIFFQCDIIFLPCGHLCACSLCDRDLTQCPLCRSAIAQRVKI